MFQPKLGFQERLGGQQCCSSLSAAQQVPKSLGNYVQYLPRVGSGSAWQLGAKGEDHHWAILTMSVKLLGLGYLFCTRVKGLGAEREEGG